MSIKPIQTLYKGYRFRSRLEARWAVFLDAIQANWTYEPEGYELSAGWYLPDFFVEYSPSFSANMNVGSRGVHIEVKPHEPTQHEQSLLLCLAKQTNCMSYLVVGPPGDNCIYRAGPYSERVFSFTFGLDPNDQEDRFVELSILFGCLHRVNGYDEFYLPNERQAARAARQARFEHGESPQ
jgi:hypothetical protein